MADAQTRVSIAPGVRTRMSGAELVILDFKGGEYFALGAVGAAIWHGLEKGEALGAIADAIAREHDVARDTALRDAIDLVAQLVDKGLVTAR